MDLWKEVARRLKLDYEIRELSVADFRDPAKMAALDVFVSLNVSADREAELDLTHAFYSTGLAIAVAPKDSGGLLATLHAIFTPKFAKLIAALMGVLLAIGVLMWLAERRGNSQQFGGSAAHGIGAGLWWSAVTMTTVGYGDKSPVTIGGRILGLAWMFIAIIIISIFTASITSTLTVDRLESAIKGPDDLPRFRVVTLAGSTSAAYLDRHHITYKAAPTILDGMKAVAANEADAMVYDAPVLQYLAKHELGGSVAVLTNVFEHQDYGFALPDGSSLREELNRALLTQLGTEEWHELVAKYLGREN
jgi:ABC-type amino acid transport substrate-binding protein